ncbi:hypothetical protein GCM10027605_16490 [Micromonospora zhanjiangensis]
MADRCAMYGLIQTQVRSPRAASRASIPGGSGKVRLSHSKSHQWYSRIQNVSKWNTLSGRSRSAMPSTNRVTVASSYGVVKDVVSHRPNDHGGGSAGRPVSAV